MAPAQAFRQQQLVNARALDRNPLDLIQICLQPIERPAGKREPQVSGVRQARRNHRAHLLRAVCGGASWPWLLFQPRQALAIEALEPAQDRGGGELQRLGDGRHALALVGQPEDAGSLDCAARGRGEWARRCMVSTSPSFIARTRNAMGHLLWQMPLIVAII